MGTGVGAAIEAADISVLSGDLRGVARALRLARETYTIVLQNLGWAFGYNLIALPLAITGLLSPALAPWRWASQHHRQSPTACACAASEPPAARRPCAAAPPAHREHRADATICRPCCSAASCSRPDSFAVPRSSSITLAEPAGESIDVRQLAALRPGAGALPAQHGDQRRGQHRHARPGRCRCLLHSSYC